MEQVHRAIFFGMFAGILCILLLAGYVSPQLAFASNQDSPKQPAGVFSPSPTPENTQPSQDTDATFFTALALVMNSLTTNPTPLPPQAAPVSEPAPSSPPARSEPETRGCSLSSRFPESVRQWCGLIEHYAAENGLEPGLVAAVMLQESGGNARALSGSGAVGLLQVMPRDGIAASFQCANGPCFRSRPSSSELYDPEFNIRFGTGMLAGLVNKYGSVREGLHSYGPSNGGYYYADKVLGIYQGYR